MKNYSFIKSAKLRFCVENVIKKDGEISIDK